MAHSGLVDPGTAPSRILFLCTGNACRSQMAEGWARHLFPGRFEVASAGLVPYRLDPRTVRVMGEVGIDVSSHWAKGLEEVGPAGFDWVITLCPAADAHCPAFPSPTRVFHRAFTDPFAARGSDEEQLRIFRAVRDRIGDFVRSLPVLLSSGRAR